MALSRDDVVLGLANHFELPDVAGLAALFVLPFAHENLAIVFGAYAIASNWLPMVAVAACIYAGMVACDFTVYGIGACARRLPWLSRLAIDHRVRRFGQSLDGNLIGLFAVCRLVPGAALVAFVACGWMRVSLARFAASSLLMSALYLPIMLYLVVVFGEALGRHIGLWSWAVLLAALIAMTFVRRRVFGFASAGDDVVSGSAGGAEPDPHARIASSAVTTGARRGGQAPSFSGPGRARSLNRL